MKFLLSCLLCSILEAESIALNWKLNSPEEKVSFYTLVQSKNGSSYRVFKYLSPKASSLIIKNVKPGDYKFFIFAYNEGGASTASRCVHIIIKDRNDKNHH